MTGVKYEIAYKRGDKEKGSAGEVAQRRKTIKILKKMIEELEKEESLMKEK